MGIIDKLALRIRRDVGIGVARTYVYKRTAADAAPADVACVPGLRIAAIAPGEIGALGALGFAELDEWEQRLVRGDVCYGAWLDGQLAHYSWIQAHGRHDLAPAGVEVEVEPGSFWIYNCRTADGQRGKRIYPCTLQRIVREQFAAGATTAWIYTTAENVASQRGIACAGFAAERTLRALRFGRTYRSLDTRLQRPVSEVV